MNGVDFTLVDKLKIRGSYTMNRQGSSFFSMRTHHFVIALVAILMAVALVSNYYLNFIFGEVAPHWRSVVYAFGNNLGACGMSE